VSYYVTIAESDVVGHISGAELEALRAAALADGQEDPVEPSIEHVTGMVRGYVAANTDNTLDSDATTIPRLLLSPACDLVVAEIIGRVPGYDLDQERTDKRKEAMRILRDVAAGTFAIEDPTTGAVPTGAAVSVVDKNTRDFTRDKMNGL